MKKYLPKILIVIVLFVLIMPHQALAVKKERLQTDITGDSFQNMYDPEKLKEGTITRPVTKAIIAVVNPVLGVIQVIGGLVMVASIGMFGFKMLLSVGKGEQGPDTKIRLLDYGGALLKGSTLMFFSVTFVKFIFRALTGMI